MSYEIERINKRIAEIDSQMTKLQTEKDKLISERSLPEIELKIKDYLERTYNGKQLSNKHDLMERGLWEVLGEDPNCDLGGAHYTPKLGVVDGTLKDALTFAMRNNNFYTWGGGGEIVKIKPIII